MMSLLVDLGLFALLLTLLLGALAVWRIGQVVSWRALAMTARATHSFADCVALIRYCAEERHDITGDWLHRQQEARLRSGSGHLFEEWPRAS